MDGAETVRLRKKKSATLVNDYSKAGNEIDTIPV